MDNATNQRQTIIWIIIAVVIIWAIIYYVTPSREEKIRQETIEALNKSADYPPPTEAEKNAVRQALEEKI